MGKHGSEKGYRGDSILPDSRNDDEIEQDVRDRSSSTSGAMTADSVRGCYFADGEEDGKKGAGR